MTLPITEVTVLEDRAHIVRAGVVRVAAGVSTATVVDVSPVLVSKTLEAKVVGDASARVIDARVEVKEVSREADRPAAQAAIAAEIKSVERQRDALVSADQLLAREAEGLSEIAEQTIEEMSDDAAFGRVDEGAWGQQLAEIEGELAEIGVRRQANREGLRDLAQTLSDLYDRQRAAETPSATSQLVLTLRIDAEAAGEVPVRLSYLVPSACWRPAYRAQLNEGADGATVAVEAFGTVWQNTGEDWTDVRLFFSTERPSLGSSPPPLTSDKVRTKKKAEKLEVSARQEEINTTGLGGGGKKVIDELPGIDDGGAPIRLEAKEVATVRSDGRATRIGLGQFDAAATVKRVVMGELAQAVLLQSEQVNNLDRALLPGPVDLIRDAGIVGRTEVEYTAAGERFEMGWGPDTDLRVTRTASKKEEASKLLSSWITVPHIVGIKISNLAQGTKSLTVTERVPVSEIDKVKIDVDRTKTTGGVVPDPDGILSWRIDVPGRDRKKLRLSYVVKKHSDVVGL